jgi:hypothetical protein
MIDDVQLEYLNNSLLSADFSILSHVFKKYFHSSNALFFLFYVTEIQEILISIVFFF